MWSGFEADEAQSPEFSRLHQTVRIDILSHNHRVLNLRHRYFSKVSHLD